MKGTTIGSIVALVLLWALLAAAQTPARVPQIEYFWPSHPLAKTSPRLEAFRQGLRDFGWVGAENIAIEYR
jgi:hypothetical protein